MSERSLKLVVCIPGKNFSKNFLLSWSGLLAYLIDKKIQVKISINYSPNIYYSRNLCLCGDIRKGKLQPPLTGIDYDYILWIDSDMVFVPENFEALLAHDKDIVAGVYPMDVSRFAVVEKQDFAYLAQNGSFQFMNIDENKNKGLVSVLYAGLGFTLVKKGVFEALQYPWFSPLPIEFDKISDFTTEDVSFCVKAQKAGFTIFADTSTILGHEKGLIL